MTHRLILLRHAKAEQGGRDRDRALTNRGHADAAAAGTWLAANDAVPDVVVVSPSRRTTQTWEAVAANLPGEIDVTYDDRIYDNSVQDLLAVIRDVDAKARTVLLVGHNPSTHALSVTLAGGESARELAEFPTATIAVFDVDGAWQQVPDVPTRLITATTCRAGHSVEH